MTTQDAHPPTQNKEEAISYRLYLICTLRAIVPVDKVGVIVCKVITVLTRERDGISTLLCW